MSSALLGEVVPNKFETIIFALLGEVVSNTFETIIFSLGVDVDDNTLVNNFGHPCLVSDLFTFSRTCSFL